MSIESQNFSVDVCLFPENAILKRGETFKATVLLKKAGQPVIGQRMVFTTKWESAIVKEETVVSDGSPLKLSYTSDKAGWCYFCIVLLDDNGNVIQDPGTGNRQLHKKHLATEFGALFSPDEIIAADYLPDDFDAFWAAEREKLNNCKLEATLVPQPVESKYEGKVELFAVSVACLGRAPVTGYLTIPVGAREKSLTAIIDYESHVVQDAPKNIACEASLNAQAIAFSVSWHGLETGHPKEWYVQSMNEIYIDCGRHNVQDPVKWFFHDMYYRVMRALDYIKSRPEWNGRDLIVRGGSLGGIQTLAAAALDKDITLAIISVPSACDYNAQASGRVPQGCFRAPEVRHLLLDNPAILKSLSYHDGVNFARRITCETYVCTGFADETCYPSNVFSMYNALATQNKFMSTNPFTGHFGTTRNTEGDKRLSRALNTVTVLQDPI